MTDDGYVVVDAVRLDDALQELRGIFEMFGVLPPDLSHRAHNFYTQLAAGMPFYGSSTEEEAGARTDWVARSFLASAAEESLKFALVSGDLTIWTASHDGERASDHRVLFASSACHWHATLTIGRYIPVQGQPPTPPSYVQARLWIKHSDWRVFRAHAIQTRGGGDGEMLLRAVSLGTATSPQERVQFPPATAAKGRPSGSGYDRVDAAIVEQMLALKREGRVKSLTEAAGLFADQTTGASREAIIRRLQRAATAKEKNGD
jgi:hypothetical protein